MTTRSAVVVAEGLRRTFPPGTEALKDATFEIVEGESVAITGRSGSGKTTLLALLGLLDTPTAGELTLAGRRVSGLGDIERTAFRRASIGFVFQSFHLVPHLTAMENVELALRIREIRSSVAIERARAALESVGLTHRADALPGTLSGGEQQRVAIARALSGEPAILLCDEPTGNLDRANADQILNLLEEQRRVGTTTIIVTHDSSVAARCARSLVVEDGVVAG